MMAAKAGVVNIHGKEYKTVAARVAEFREECPGHAIETQLISADDERVVMKALISVDGRLLATGYAEEVRASSNINRTSALENCETSAIGRALAAYGFAGTEYASADEVAGAISQQKINEAVGRLVKHNDAWKRHHESIHFIKSELALGNLSAAWEAWQEIPEDDQIALKIAATKGGVFTVEEGKLMKEAQAQDFDPERGVYRSIADKESK